MSHTIPSNAPFQKDQIDALNAILSTIDADQANWLSGFLSRGGGDSSTTKGSVPVTVLFGSESGNAETLAGRAKESLAQAGYAAEIKDMADVKVADLEKIENLLVIVSTWGEGDPPARVEDFYEKFMGEGAPKLAKTRFSVCGLGDSSYADFCKMGKDFDKRLAELGAEKIFETVECDVEFEAPYGRWIEGTINRLKEVASTGAVEVKGGASPKSDDAVSAPEKPNYDKKNPFPAPLLKKYNLNGEGSAKETIHAEISLEGSGLTYEAGDALGVVPQNAPDLISAFLEATGIEGRENVAFGDDLAVPFEEVLRDHLDLRVVTKLVIQKYAKISGNQDLFEKSSDSAWVKEYAWGRDWVDVCKEYPRHGMGAGDFVRILRPLSPRLYSIASSIKAHPNEVHLTVGAVRYDAYGREKKGVCSTYIADLWNESQTAGVYFHHNKNFKLPADGNTPIIMVGPGTGIAPFRAFLEERVAMGAKGKNWLIFGDQHEATDYLYQEDWEKYQKNGHLDRVDLAFSRDQDYKIYVQDRLRENAAAIWKWIDEGGYFYVCGDARRMAKDVHQALIDIIGEQGGMSVEDATKYLKQMQKDRRYGRDVY